MTNKDIALIEETLRSCKPPAPSPAAMQAWSDCVHALGTAIKNQRDRFSLARFINRIGAPLR